jgi:hypothetical protein
MHGPRLLGVMMPAHDILPAMRAPLHNALSVFENYWFIGMSGEVLAKNGSLDPLASAIRQYAKPPRPDGAANENRRRDGKADTQRSRG